MDRKYKILLVSIIVLIILIIIMLLLLININSNEDSVNIIGEPGIEVDYSSVEIQPVEDKVQYYTVKNCINNYLGVLNINSSIYYIGGEIQTDIQKENINDLLSSEYKEEKNITLANLLDNIETFEENCVFIPLQMNVLEGENVDKYVAYGVIQTSIENKFIKEVYYIVNLDYKNKTFSIEPIDDKYSDINQIKITNKNNPITDNGSNIYMDQKITNEYLVKEYFNLYKKLTLSEPEIIYNIMTEEYKEVRFENLDNFKEYVDNNLEEIKKINLRQYLVNYYDNYTEYVGKDQFGNLYVFKEYTGEKIQIELDTYTITTDKFIEEYQKAEVQRRVQMNVDKFIQMINRSDYITSYNCISEGFKNNYFSTQEEFKNYIENNFFKYNKFEFKNLEQKGSNIYVCTVQVTDLTEKTQEARDINIIMQLNDGINFEMSFSME